MYAWKIMNFYMDVKWLDELISKGQFSCIVCVRGRLQMSVCHRLVMKPRLLTRERLVKHECRLNFFFLKR